MTEIIANRYQIETELGTGGMGTVYRGIDTQTNQTVAIKQLHADVLKQDPEVLERFRREGQALRDLNHPNIVKMLDAVQENGINYLVLEYISGGDLSDILDEEQLSIKRILNIAIDLADALTRAHRLDIIHRDLKPANILLAQDGTIRLTDFGVARIAGKERVTGTNAVIGTLDYMPPEAFQKQAIDSRADIWAFGVILFEMLADERPFVGDDFGSTLASIIYHEPPDLEDLRDDAPIPLVDLIYRMLEKDPHARISSVRHIGAALEDILQGRDSSVTAIPKERFHTPTPVAIEQPKHNLPLQTTAFVGRETEVAELSRLINQNEGRLVTILGPGGMGKTRLALEVASRVAGIADSKSSSTTTQNLFRDGVFFVDLAPLSDSANIINALAEATHYQFQEDGRNPQQQVLDYLNQKQMLLLMDNYEHIMQGVGIVTQILQNTTNIKIIATSRQKLNQTGETVFNLEGMDFPQWETPEDALEYAAVKLFMQSAKRTRPDFELGADDLPAVARICRLVRGMPLGILLAASWLAMLNPQEIAEEIQQGMDFLESDMGDLPDRHRSIRAVFDYSWDLMNDVERDVFAKLSIFKGGFTREAAQSVTNANLRTLMNLMNKSLIRRDADSGRYEVHELLRQYAYEQLQMSGQESETIQAHISHYSDWLAKLETKLKGHGQVAALAAIDADFENIRLAWTKAIQNHNGDSINQMLESLYWYCIFRTRHQEGFELFQQARQQFSANSDTADLVSGRLSTRFPEDIEDPVPIFERALAIAQHHNNPLESAWCTRVIGHHISHGYIDPAKGNRIMEDCLTMYQQLGNDYLAALVLDDLSWGYNLEGALEKRIPTIKGCIALRQKIGDQIGIANALRNLGSAYTIDGNLTDAEQALREGEQMALHLGDRANLAWCKILLTMTKIRLNMPPEDDPDLLAIEKLITDIGHPVLKVLIQIYRGVLVAVRGDYQQAMAILQKVYPIDQPPIIIYAYLGEWTYSMIGAGLPDYALLKLALQRAFGIIPLTSAFLPAMLPGAVCFLAHINQHEFATELLGLISILPDYVRWSDDWPPLLHAKSDLQQQLGDEAYQAAFERGKEYDFVEIIDQIQTMIEEA